MGTYNLPRKIKTAFSNTEEDSAHCTVTDLGFLAVDNNGKRAFKLYIGGGLGRNPRTSVEFDELIDEKDVLYCLEAMTNLGDLSVLYVDYSFLSEDDRNGMKVSIGIKKGNTELRDEINSALAKLTDAQRQEMMGAAATRSASSIA